LLAAHPSKRLLGQKREKRKREKEKRKKKKGTARHFAMCGATSADGKGDRKS
jgi:hypothetical protein